MLTRVRHKKSGERRAERKPFAIEGKFLAHHYPYYFSPIKLNYNLLHAEGWEEIVERDDLPFDIIHKSCHRCAMWRRRAHSGNSSIISQYQFLLLLPTNRKSCSAEICVTFSSAWRGEIRLRCKNVFQSPFFSLKSHLKCFQLINDIHWNHTLFHHLLLRARPKKTVQIFYDWH